MSAVKGYIRDGCALFGGTPGLAAAVIKQAVDDRDWDWLLGKDGNGRELWLDAAEIGPARFMTLVHGAKARLGDKPSGQAHLTGAAGRLAKCWGVSREEALGRIQLRAIG